MRLTILYLLIFIVFLVGFGVASATEHPNGWLTTHKKEVLIGKVCSDCHQPKFCTDCHSGVVTVSKQNGIIPGDQIVAEYHFEGDTKDSSGNNNHGTIQGATFVDGVNGYALSLDGVDDYFTAPINDSFNSIKTQGTIEAWFNFKDRYLIYESGISCSYGSRALMLWRFGTYNIKSQAGIDCAGRIGSDWRIGNPDGGAVKAGSAISQPLKSGQWYHIALVYNSNEVILYINGRRVKSSDFTGELNDAEDKFWIGRNGNAYQPMYYHGLIDEVKIYNYALSDSEVQASYNSALSQPRASPQTLTPTSTETVPISKPSDTVPKSQSNFVSSIIAAIVVIGILIAGVFYKFKNNSKHIDVDNRVMNYLTEKEGKISLSTASKDLKLSETDIKNTISRLKQKGQIE